MEENKAINNEEEAKPPNNEQPLNNPSTDETIVPAETTDEAEQPQNNKPHTTNRRYGSTSSHSRRPRKEKLEVLLLGIFNAIPRCVLRIFGRVSVGA